MTSDTIKHGEAYDVSITAKDAAGVVLDMDGTWEAMLRITRGQIGGPVVATLEMTIADSAASVAIDTRAAIWSPGVYIYDVRLTDPEGYDYWSQPVQLFVETRNTPASV